MSGITGEKKWEKYLVLVSIVGSYTIETEAENAQHAKAIVLQRLALDEDILLEMDMTEYAIQWDSVSAVHEENGETAGGSGFATDSEAEMNTRAEALFIKWCEAIVEGKDLKDMAREVLATLKNRKERKR
jgi:hypothetical protein